MDNNKEDNRIKNLIFNYGLSEDAFLVSARDVYRLLNNQKENYYYG